MKLFLLILLFLYCYDSLAFLLPSIVSLRLRMFKQNSECVLSAESPQFQREKPYFLRKALMADLSFASKILADGFYEENHAVSKWWEKIQTQMSLESNLPLSGEQHEMWVACEATSGQVVAFCELDNRPPKVDCVAEVRPYMCNLAVAKHWRNQGLAQKMIRTCEESVKGWQEDRLFLKVRESNQPALKLYKKLGYEIAETQLDIKTNHTLLVMKRAWGNSKEDQRDVDTALIREGSFERRSI